MLAPVSTLPRVTPTELPRLADLLTLNFLGDSNPTGGLLAALLLALIAKRALASYKTFADTEPDFHRTFGDSEFAKAHAQERAGAMSWKHEQRSADLLTHHMRRYWAAGETVLSLVHKVGHHPRVGHKKLQEQHQKVKHLTPLDGDPFDSAQRSLVVLMACVVLLWLNARQYAPPSDAIVFCYDFVDAFLDECKGFVCATEAARATCQDNLLWEACAAGCEEMFPRTNILIAALLAVPPVYALELLFRWLSHPLHLEIQRASLDTEHLAPGKGGPPAPRKAFSIVPDDTLRHQIKRQLHRKDAHIKAVYVLTVALTAVCAVLLAMQAAIFTAGQTFWWLFVSFFSAALKFALLDPLFIGLFAFVRSKSSKGDVTSADVARLSLEEKVRPCRVSSYIVTCLTQADWFRFSFRRLQGDRSMKETRAMERERLFAESLAPSPRSPRSPRSPL